MCDNKNTIRFSEIFCGPGRISEVFKELISQNLKIVNNDIHDEIIQIFETLIQNSNSQNKTKNRFNYCKKQTTKNYNKNITIININGDNNKINIPPRKPSFLELIINFFKSMIGSDESSDSENNYSNNELEITSTLNGCFFIFSNFSTNKILNI